MDYGVGPWPSGGRRPVWEALGMGGMRGVRGIERGLERAPHGYDASSNHRGSTSCTGSCMGSAGSRTEGARS